MPSDLTFDITIVEASDMEARLVVRARAEGDALRGHVTGPFCDRAQTLPATLPLRAIEHGDQLLAEAVVPDPCFWTPELPFQYRVQIEIGDEKFEEMIALRRPARSDEGADRP